MQSIHDELPLGPTGRLFILPEGAGGSNKLEQLVELIMSLKETVTQQNNIVKDMRSDLTTIKAEQEYPKNQNSKLQGNDRLSLSAT